MRYLCSLFGASTDDLVTAETPACCILGQRKFSSQSNLTPEELATTLGLLLTKQLELLSPQQPHQPGLPSVLSLSNQPAHLKFSLHHQTPQQ